MTVHRLSEPDEILTRQELAAELKISLPTLDKLRAAGLPSETWGLRTVRFRRRKVLSWLAQYDASLGE
jgi:phage terminase Nu1 subunit (DNA packaging protein)